MAPAEFSVCLRLWLGLASRLEMRSLSVQGSEMHGRHNAIRDCLFAAARVADLRPWREAAVDSSGQRPADVFLPSWSFGRPLAVDVTVSHPSQGIAANQARVGTTASERAALAKVDEKKRKYEATCMARGVDLLPVAVCAFGGWLPPAEDFINKLAGRVSERASITKSVAANQLWQQVSTALWRGNARLVLRHAAPACLDGEWAAAAVRDVGPRA